MDKNKARYCKRDSDICDCGCHFAVGMLCDCGCEYCPHCRQNIKSRCFKAHKERCRPRWMPA